MGGADAESAAAKKLKRATITVVRRASAKTRGVTGRVRGPRGARIAGARVRLTAVAFGTGRKLSETTVRPKRKGTFVVRAANRQACIVRVTVRAPGYRRTKATVRFMRKPTLVVAPVRARVGFGERIALVGRVRGDAGANVGRTVRVQALASRRWITAGTAAVKARGVITWTYRLKRTRRPSNYRFRLKLPKTAGVPWGALTSSSRLVKIRP